MFNNGVDYYITKPFEVRKFLLRIIAVLRRYKISKSPINNTNILQRKKMLKLYLKDFLLRINLKQDKQMD